MQSGGKVDDIIFVQLIIAAEAQNAHFAMDVRQTSEFQASAIFESKETLNSIYSGFQNSVILYENHRTVFLKVVLKFISS